LSRKSERSCQQQGATFVPNFYSKFGMWTSWSLRKSLPLNANCRPLFCSPWSFFCEKASKRPRDEIAKMDKLWKKSYRVARRLLPKVKRKKFALYRGLMSWWVRVFEIQVSFSPKVSASNVREVWSGSFKPLQSFQQTFDP